LTSSLGAIGQTPVTLLPGCARRERDAEAIAERVQRPTMKFVATKTADQLDLQALHRVRERLVGQRTGVINQIRAFVLERGMAVRQGLRFLRSELPRLLTTPRTFCHPAWCGSSKTWLAIGVGSTNGSSDYRTRLKRSRARTAPYPVIVVVNCREISGGREVDVFYESRRLHVNKCIGRPF
jgi:hypothetical protein